MVSSNNDSNVKIDIKQVKTNGMTFKCRTAGLGNGGEPIIFLHGFPESSIIWNKIMLHFASEGYQCVAPDQRGYSEGARPKGKENYTMKNIASDVIAIADELGFKKIHLVGHDWGSGAGWSVVELYPDRVNDWTAMSVPHMAAFDYAKHNDPYQMEKSGYIDRFQVPLLPELKLKAKDYKVLRDLWVVHPKEEIEDYLNILRKFSGRKAAINWYRANKEFMKYGDVSIPTLFIWGNNDLAIGRVGVEMTKQYMKGEYKFVELDAGHWLIQEKYDVVLKEISEQIKGHPISC